MTPGVYDFTIYQGATFAPVLTWKDDAGVAINLTGWTARMQIRDRQSSAVLVDFTTGNGKITLGGIAGTIAPRLTAVETAALAWFWGVYDLELIAPGGDVTRLLQGAATLSLEATH